jgi:predicted RNase H-like HicB family nuclease
MRSLIGKAEHWWHPFPGGILMGAKYNAVIQQHGDWWIGWIEEVPGVNSQGRTREELLENPQDALEEALEMNRADARAAVSGVFEEVSIPA